MLWDKELGRRPMPPRRNPKRQKGLATVIVTKPSYLQNDGLFL